MLIPVILSGGAGTRLWPVSREARPNPFIPLPDGESNGEREFFVNTNESTYIPAGHKHRLENTGIIDLVMIEVQSGDYLVEDDILRFEDTYGRVNS